VFSVLHCKYFFLSQKQRCLPHCSCLSLSALFNMSDSSRQIKQMVNFIMQEAHEKVNEIRIKVATLYTRALCSFSLSSTRVSADGSRF
jgi:hypothetical protein